MSRMRSHPAARVLLRFVRAEPLAPAERRAVVRHLLGGCPRCLALTRPVWELGQGRRAGEGGRVVRP